MNLNGSPSVPAPDPRQILDSIGEVVYDWDILTDTIVWGPNVCDVLRVEHAADISTGTSFARRLSADSPSSRYEAVMQSQDRDPGCGVRYEVLYGLVPEGRDQASERVWVEDCGRWFGGMNGRPARAHGIVRVVTQRYETERELSFLSRCDPLTGALNRVQFTEHLTRQLADAVRSRSTFGLLLIGVDSLSGYNRNFGFDVGDEIIAQVALRLRSQLRATDSLARFAGNKFAILLDSCDEEQMSAAARRFLEIVAKSEIETAAGQFPVSLRIGGVIAPSHGRVTQILFQCAEEALEAARSLTEARYCVFEPNHERSSIRLRTQQTAEQILAALNGRKVEIAFEPVVHATTCVPAFHEALIRLRLDSGEVLTPLHFLPVAERVGLISLLDNRVMELAVERLMASPSLCLSINVSGATLQDMDFPGRFHAALARTPGLGERLIVEITETAAISDLDRTRKIITMLKESGARVAMDDFGAGHTSFRNLRGLDFDIIKIDGAFVQNIARSSDDRFFVRTLLDLANHLGIATVAEWVEDEETANLLRGWGVTYFQGELYGRARAEILPPVAIAPTRAA